MRPYRKEKMGSTIRDIVSRTILHRLHDPRISPLTTVTHVEVGSDLLTAKVYLSVVGTRAEESKTFAAIKHASGYIQRVVAGKLEARQCPQLTFIMDESDEVVRRTMAILEENLLDNPALAAEPPGDDVDPSQVADQVDLDAREGDSAQGRVE